MKAVGAHDDQPLRPLRAWLLGAVLTAVLLPLVLRFLVYGLAIFALLSTVLVLRGPRAAFGGAILLVSGLWFTYLDLSMKARCAAMNTGGGFCEVLNPTESAIPGLLFVIAGAALSTYALLVRRHRRKEIALRG